MPRQTTEFQTIRSEGGLLPPDILRKVVDPRSTLPGTKPEDYGLPQGERINESITQSWNRLLRHWAEFRKAAQNLPPNEPGTGLTNDKWNIPLLRELGFGLIPTGPGPEIDGKTYAINRFFGPTPIHLVGCGVNLDRRAAGVRGAAQANPHGLVQDFLNRSPGHLWSILSNGLRFRVLRDNQALSRQSYLEFDLEAIFSGEVFSDFVLLWLMAHATRFNPGESGRPDSCWLERWTKIAEEEGTRALGALRIGVENTLQILGEAFVSHPRNSALRDSLRSGSLSLNDFHIQLLRLVYRLIFLFVAEDRSFEGNSLLHPIDDSDSALLARDRYARHYSTARLRELAGKIKGSRHGDLWQQFNLLVGALSGKPAFDPVRLNLALPSLGSSLWDPQSTTALNTVSLNQATGIGPQGTELANADLLEALRNLAFTRQGKVLRPVDYKNLGAEELGGVYESLLALTPQISADGARFTFAEFAGNQRKTSGSYYTPDSLVQCLLDSALDPVVEQALKGKTGADAENALLSLKICDPAVGSGHFLVGAAHRLARHLSRVRAYSQGDSEPSPIQYQQALRDVIGRCLYGVDINPMSAELCKFSLWMEALEPGKPLDFLDHHIQVGNSLLGTTPALMAQGIPDAAFEPIEGDDKKVCTEYKKLNKSQRTGQEDMFDIFAGRPWERQGNLAASIINLDSMPSDTPEQVEAKAKAYKEAIESGPYQSNRLLADAWCAAFVWKKAKNNHPEGFLEPITQKTFETLAANPQKVPIAIREEMRRIAKEFQFFHWHISFPEVFRIPIMDEPAANDKTGWTGGFDIVLGNPPWDLVTADPNGPKGDTLPRVQRMFGTNQYEVLSGRRDLYKLFMVQMPNLVCSFGNLGILVPLGVFMEDESSDLRIHLFRLGAITDHRHYQNGSKSFFDHVHASYRFCHFIWSPQTGLKHRFWTVATCPDEIVGQVPIDISPDKIREDLGGTYSAVLYSNQSHVIAHQKLNRILSSDKYMAFRVVAEFHATSDKQWLLNERRCQTDWIVLKNRNIHQFNSEFAPAEVFVSADVVRDRLNRKVLDSLAWFNSLPRLVFRDIARNDDERTLIACLAGPGMVSSYDTPMVVPETNMDIMAFAIAAYGACLNSFLFDFVIRPYVDKHIKGYVINRVRWPSFQTLSEHLVQSGLLLPRILELSYNTINQKFSSIVYGWNGPPFRWDEERRFQIRCELDAAFFHLYLPTDEQGRWKPARVAEGAVRDETPEELATLEKAFPTPRDAVAYIMETFPIVKRKDEATHGHYRTKDKILEIYDAMQQAIITGTPYQSPLNPPPGPPTDENGNFLSYSQINPANYPHIHPPRS